MAAGALPELIVVSQDPFNAEAPLACLKNIVTPSPLFYVRNHFSVPHIDARSWRLAIRGKVRRGLDVPYERLRSLPQRELLATLECAGNGRSAFRPAIEGEPWEYGAVSTAHWRGVSLAEVLEFAGLEEAVRELVVVGADSGHVPAAGRELSYVRGLPIDKALHPDTLLALEMNGEPLTPRHGFPARLIVPGWYGMASVKWVTRIDAIEEKFRGFYQVDRYVLAYPDRPDVEPLQRMAVRSLVTHPIEGAEVSAAETLVAGFAWSGEAPVERVEVSVDGGGSWAEAEMTSGTEPYAWRTWQYRWRPEKRGATTLQSRARDSLGNEQPATCAWNEHGYGNNAIRGVTVHVTNRG
ncbi:MAG: sulfite oxidase [Chloroflexota bacterium]|nr:MAG: sulfite oxidase [Chloroflexota bacterium]